MNAIILAAGRGSRMKEHTAERPKCLLELAGRPLLGWQLDALRAAGAHDILVVRGYQAERLSPEALPWAGAFQVLDNPHWEHSNMLRTLCCADAAVRQMFAQGEDRGVVSYSDIVYHPDHVRALASCPHDMAITYDDLWEPLWRLRFGDPLLDAETFRQENGLLREIGNKPRSMDEIHGQYMGLLAFTKKGWEQLAEACARLGDQLDRTDMTSFLRGLLAANTPVGTVPVRGRWCEADNGTDLESYEQALKKGGWTHDWR